MKTKCWMLAAALLATAGGAGPAMAADAYPSRPIRILVNTAPGGLTDVTARLIARKMGETLKQSVVVENRPGGDGLIGIRDVKGAAPDGYTILASAGTIANQMALKLQPGYDLQKDFAGIGLMGRSPFLLVEEPKHPDRTLADFIARAKANPEKLTYASAGVGTVPHIAMETFMQQTGIKVMHVPYKGNGAAMPDVLSGRVDTILEAYGSSGAKITGGQLRALAVTSTARIPSLPDVPTFAEQGVPGYSYYTWMCLMAPAGTPKDVVQRLADALRAATSSAEVQERFRSDGMEAVNMSTDEFKQFLAREVARVTTLVNDLGIPRE